MIWVLIFECHYFRIAIFLIAKFFFLKIEFITIRKQKYLLVELVIFTKQKLLTHDDNTFYFILLNENSNIPISIFNEEIQR